MTAGIINTDFGSTDLGYSTVLQTDGNIVLAGFSWNGSNWSFSVARYNSSYGSLDPSFSDDGQLITEIGANATGHSAAIQSDGKILVAGNSWNGTDYDFALVRYNIDGSLDSNFSDDGKLTTNLGSTQDYAKSVIVQADEKIVVAGTSLNGNAHDFSIVRYNNNGSLDSGFGSNGIVHTAVGSGQPYSTGVAIQENGKLLVTGISFNGSDTDFTLLRYNTDGSLDTGFGIDGIVTTTIGTNDESSNVIVQSDGKILVAGRSYNGSYYDMALVRYNSDGSLDNSFSADGKLTTAFGSFGSLNDFDGHISVALQANGKILLGGKSYNGNSYDITLARYNSDGSLDMGFGNNGKVITGTKSNTNKGFSLQVQTDGKIVAGTHSDDNGNENFTVVRYNSDGSLDSTFDGITDDLVGNTGDEEIDVGVGDDTVYGGGGKDSLIGGSGNDSLNGGDGDDVLKGDAGRDTMQGGAGNDTYYLDSEGNDVILDSGGSEDQVIMPYQLSKYTLDPGIENATITDKGKSAPENLTNASFDNSLTGNNLDNALTGNNVRNNLIGGSGKDVLKGDQGNDKLDGGTSNDLLFGGSGNDIFKLADFSKDTIKDFSVPYDTIQLENSVFKQLNRSGQLKTDYFEIGNQAHDTNDYIIYNSTTGALYYDSDGTGNADALQIALLGANLHLTDADFIII